MFRNPAVIGVNVKSPNVVAGGPPDRMLQDLGNNIGNILFTESLYSVLRNSRRSTYHFASIDFAGCDVVVVAAANWMNSHSDFGALAKRLEQARLPVVICGIGAQVSPGEKIPSLKDGTLRLIQLAAESSKAISVRGDFSCDVLDEYGIKNVISTGCPSLLLAGASGPKLREDSTFSTSDVTLHATRHLFNRSEDGFQNYLYRQALRLGSDIVLQSELADIYCALDVNLDESKRGVTEEIFASAYGEESVLIKSYLRTHGKVFVRLSDWVEYLITKKFCIGSRVHGTIASLIAGTPAVLMAHDKRTEEMAIRMGLPFVLEKDVDTSRPLDPKNYYDAEKFKAFVTHYDSYRRNFISFFDTVGLPFDFEFSGVV